MVLTNLKSSKTKFRTSHLEVSFTAVLAQLMNSNFKVNYSQKDCLFKKCPKNHLEIHLSHTLADKRL